MRGILCLVQQSFDEADKIYVLDMPGYLYKSRIIMRSIKENWEYKKEKEKLEIGL